ncbi:MAG TPA: CoA pyrophosphatase [Polyangiaceae bacterium]|jgi:8-oxo-dGTP pyrophosphatase MutT (NUDIX family)|nr:CoA pyrophosphatase [Polyangiaceae bacterium]
MAPPAPSTFSESVRQVLASRERAQAESSALQRASVLLALFPIPPRETPHLWLVRRSEELRTHRGQVALPGGKREPKDADFLETALRESHEEIGLPPSEVDVLGVLDDRETSTGYLITPYVGWIANPFTPEPLATEVARVFSVPLAAFADEPRRTRIPWQGAEREVLSYEVAGELVWGATASILRHFIELITPSLARYLQ